MILLFVVVAVALFGLLGFVVLGTVGRNRSKAEKNADAELDALFAGAEDVAFKGNLSTMKYETVVLGAKARGYKLAHSVGDPNGAFTLLFEKA